MFGLLSLSVSNPCAASHDAAIWIPSVCCLGEGTLYAYHPGQPTIADLVLHGAKEYANPQVRPWLFPIPRLGPPRMMNEHVSDNGHQPAWFLKIQATGGSGTLRGGSKGETQAQQEHA